jgi:hypothetical protein
VKLGSLVRIEYIKTVKRRAFWVALAFMTLISTIIIGSQFHNGKLGQAAPFVPPFTWPMATSELGPMPAIFLALTLVMLVTSEYTWRTARQNVIDGLSKEQFFAAKWVMAMLVALAFVFVPFAIATGTGIYGRMTGATPTSAAPDTAAARRDSTARATSMKAMVDSTAKAMAAAKTAADSAHVLERWRSDSAQAALRQAIRDVRSQRPRATYPPPDPDAPLVSVGDLKVAAGYSLGALGFASMAFMLATMLRSTGGAIGVFFLYIAFLEQMFGLLLRRFGSVELASKVMPYMPMTSFQRPMAGTMWHAEYVERMNVVAASLGQPAQVITPEYFKLIGLPLLWIGVFVGLSFLVFRKRDL